MEIKNQNTGFTLIELLVVIAIIALLASVVITSLSKSRSKARDTKRVSEMNQLAKALELFFNSNFSYPTTTGVAVGTYGRLSGSSSACVSGTAGCVNSMVPNVMVRMPIAPVPVDNPPGTTICSGAVNGGVANDYLYYGTGAGVNSVNNFTVTFCIGNQTGALAPGIHTLTRGGIQ